MEFQQTSNPSQRRIHGTGIFPYIYHKNQPNVGEYTVRPMGILWVTKKARYFESWHIRKWQQFAGYRQHDAQESGVVMKG